LVSATPRSLQFVFFVEYTNQHRSLAYSNWIVVVTHIALHVQSQSLVHAAIFIKLMVWPMYIITAVLEGVSRAQLGK